MRLIRLSVKDAAILSLVAAHSKDQEAIIDLLNTLKLASKDGQIIGKLILGIQTKHSKKHKNMAERFLLARDKNEEGARMLSAQLR